MDKDKGMHELDLYNLSVTTTQSAKAVEQDFPHFVDMVVPPGGLGKRLDAMYEFHTRHTASSHSAVMVGTMPMARLFAGALLTGK